MSLTAKDSGNVEFERIEPGAYFAICSAVIDLGTQHSEAFGNDQEKVRIEWEIPALIPAGGSLPMTIAKTYTNSLNKKATLRADLVSWRGKNFTDEELKGFNLTKLLGAPCMLSIVEEASRKDPAKTYSNIKSISQLPKGTPKPQAVREPVIFDLESSDLAVMAKFPKFVQDMITASPEYKERISEANMEYAKKTGNYTGVDSASNPPVQLEELSQDDGELPF